MTFPSLPWILGGHGLTSSWKQNVRRSESYHFWSWGLQEADTPPLCSVSFFRFEAEDDKAFQTVEPEDGRTWSSNRNTCPGQLRRKKQLQGISDLLCCKEKNIIWKKVLVFRYIGKSVKKLAKFSSIWSFCGIFGSCILKDSIGLVRGFQDLKEKGQKSGQLENLSIRVKSSTQTLKFYLILLLLSGQGMCIQNIII